MKKFTLYIILCTFLISVFSMRVVAKVYNEQPYYNYIYNEWGESVPIPNAYEPIQNLTGPVLGLDDFYNPTDLFIDQKTALLYILDTENNRIVVTDVDFNLKYVIASVFVDPNKYPDQARTLNKPEGIFVNDDGIFIADTENKRLLILSNDFQEGHQKWDTKTNQYVLDSSQPAYMKTAVVKHIITKPEELRNTTKTDFNSITFKIEQVGVYKDVIYLLVEGILEGAVTFEKYYDTNDLDDIGLPKEKYRFVGYYGSNSVEQTADVLSNYFWRQLLPKTATDRMARAVPNRFTNFDFDDEGFMYTVTRESETNVDQIKKINIMGDNVLRNRHGVGGTRYGDYEIDYYINKSRNNDFIAIDINKKGIITVICDEYGRLYQYDQESNLLSIFGGRGSQLGTFYLPIAVESYEDRIYVLDKGDKGVGAVTYFTPTEFGKVVIEAVELHHKGEYDKAIPLWEKVKEYSMNYDLAYIGIGKAKQQAYEYEEALRNFYLGRDRMSYSEVFKDYRKEFVRDHFLLLIAGLIAVLYVTKLIIRHKDKILLLIFRNEKLVIKVKYPFYIMVHPIKGLSQLMYTKNGSVAVATGLLIILFITQVLQRQLTGFIFNPNNLDELNALYILMSTVIIMLIWNVSNWAYCTLADGKGRFKDIYITTAYSVVPLIVFGLLGIIISNVISADEGMILGYLINIQNIWFCILLAFSNMTIHHYSLRKTIFSMIATAIFVLLTVFIGVLLFGLFQQLFMFIESLMNEILFRV